MRKLAENQVRQLQKLDSWLQEAIINAVNIAHQQNQTTVLQKQTAYKPKVKGTHLKLIK